MLGFLDIQAGHAQNRFFNGLEEWLTGVTQLIDEPGLADDILYVSAKTGAGIDALQDRLRRAAGYRDLGEGAFTARQRHVDALRRAARHFDMNQLI